MSDQDAKDGGQAVFLTAWALVLQAIRNRGADEALRILSALDEGRTHLAMHLELCAGTGMLVATLCEAGQTDLLLTVSVDAMHGGRAAH